MNMLSHSALKQAEILVRALSRVAKIVDQPKCELLYNSFVMSSFRFSPLIWMFCGKTANKEINRVHK